MAQPISNELIELLEATCNGELTDPQFERLQQLLEADATAREAYVRYKGMDADLRHGSAPEREAFPDSQAAASVPRGLSLESDSVECGSIRRPNLRLTSLGISLAVCSAILLGVWQFGNWATHSNHEQRTPIATLARTVDAHWKSEPTGRSLYSGQQLELTDGIAELIFDSGARAILQGPVVVELGSASEARLQSGRIVVRATSEAAGFTVRTPATTIVDIGTEFGVNVDERGDSEIIVFEGEVDVERPRGEDPETASAMPASFRLTTDEVAVVTQDRVLTQPEIDRRAYIRNERLTQATHSVVLQDKFSIDTLNNVKWQAVTTAPKSSVRMVDGAVELTNRGLLATTESFDPVSLGGIRITGHWKFLIPDGATDNKRVNIFSVALRSGTRQEPGAWEIGSGISFVCYTNSSSANIVARGQDLEATKPRRHSSIEGQPFDVYAFEIMDDGRNVSFRLWTADDPTNVAHSSATVTRDASDSNRIVFYCREAQSPNWNYKVLLDDVRIETGVGPVQP